MRKLIAVSVFLLFTNRLLAQSDLILDGSNSWRFHTPDDGRTNLHIAPQVNGAWQWGLFYLESNGTLYAQGLEANHIKSNITLELKTNGINSTELLMRKQSNDYYSLYSNNGSFGIYNSSTNKSPIFINNSDNIGINTINPDEKLTVKGKIHAEEVKVDLNVPGPDYVFNEDYKLIPLSEIQSYIKTNKHLPEIPSAKEMETNGINLSEMNMLLLKKVEELTLHLIKKDEQLTQIKSEVAEIRKILNIKK